MPPPQGEVGVQRSEAASRQKLNDILVNTADAEDPVCSRHGATSHLEDAAVSTQEPNKLAPTVNAEALASWILEHGDNFKSLLSTPDMFVPTVMNAMDKSGMQATRQVMADGLSHLAALLAHTDTLIDLDTMFVMAFTKVCLPCGAALETNHRSATALKILAATRRLRNSCPARCLAYIVQLFILTISSPWVPERCRSSRSKSPAPCLTWLSQQTWYTHPRIW